MSSTLLAAAIVLTCAGLVSAVASEWANKKWLQNVPLILLIVVVLIEVIAMQMSPA